MKTFEEFWENSGILETDAFECITKNFNFKKETVPEVIKSWARTIWSLAIMDGYNVGHNAAVKESNDNLIHIVEMIEFITKENNDIEIFQKAITILKEYYGNN